MKYFEVNKVARVLVHEQPVSMVNGFPGLQKIAKKMNGKQGDLFLFVNRKADYCKVLFYHENGICIFAKQIKGRFFFNRNLQKFDLKVLSNFLLGEKKELRKAEMAARTKLANAMSGK